MVKEWAGWEGFEEARVKEARWWEDPRLEDDHPDEREIHYLFGPSVSQATPWSVTWIHGGYSVNITAVIWTKYFQRHIHS